MKKERSIKVISNSSGSNRKEAVRQCHRGLAGQKEGAK